MLDEIIVTKQHDVTVANSDGKLRIPPPPGYGDLKKAQVS